MTRVPTDSADTNVPTQPGEADQNLRAGYAAMAANEVRESEASVWIESLIADIDVEPRRLRRDRRAIRPEDLSDDDLALIAKTEVPAEHAHLDAELADWEP